MRERCALVSADYWGMSLRKQCEVLQVPRSSLYNKPKGENQINLKLMEIMDRHLTQHPTEGVVSMVYLLTGLGFIVGPKRIRRLFKLMGRETLYRRKNLTKSGLREYIRPYLLRNLKIERPNQVWVTDITYIPMQKGFMYLTAVMDVYSRKILSWGISNSQDAKWCKQVLEEAIREYGRPEIVNSDQGSQYTSALWINYLEGLDIKVSMDGKGRALDNVYIERFWKSAKYDYIYLNPSEDGYDLLKGVKWYIEYYNQKVHHTTREKPGERYFGATQKAAYSKN
jgi:putative transposase